MLEPVLFALFSVSAVVFAFNVVFRRNAVHCALHLVGVLLSLSGMFVLLNAQFIAAIQIPRGDRPDPLLHVALSLRGDLDPAPDRGHRRGRARKAEVRLMQTLSVPLEAYQLVAALLFTIGLIGVLVRRSALIIFMSIELMLNAVNLSFVAFSRQHGQMDGQIFVFFVMSVAAAEVAVGLAILVAIFRNRETTNVDQVHLLKG